MNRIEFYGRRSTGLPTKDENSGTILRNFYYLLDKNTIYVLWKTRNFESTTQINIHILVSRMETRKKPGNFSGLRNVTHKFSGLQNGNSNFRFTKWNPVIFPAYVPKFWNSNWNPRWCIFRPTQTSYTPLRTYAKSTILHILPTCKCYMDFWPELGPEIV